MATETERHPRADAVRNVERIVLAARAAFADDGPDVSLEEIARRAGVGIRTLYRHFPNKGDLIRAVLGQSVAESLTPVIERALVEENPLVGLTTLIETAMVIVARERNTLAAANSTGSLTTDLSTAFFEALTLLTGRAQQAGLVRADLLPSDLPRIMGMVVSTLWSTSSGGEAWRRYLAIVLDGMSPTGASALPPAEPAPKAPQKSAWRL